MKQYTYHFADGTSNTVEVDDEFFDILIKMSNDERKARRNYNRHNVPMPRFEYQGEDFVDSRGDAFAVLLRNKERDIIQAAIESLTESQQELIRAVYFDGRKVIDIAAELGVNHSAISNRLDRIRNKLKKILGEDRDILPFSRINSEGT